MVVITAGTAQRPGQTRLDMTAVNTKIMKSITENIMASGFNGILLIASNPVDLMTYVAQQVSGLPKNRVIGSGTILDTARLRYLMSEYLGISHKQHPRLYHGRAWGFQFCAMDARLHRMQKSAGNAR